jgi:hypothetical protein
MTERTVTLTKQQIKGLMYKCGLLSTKLYLEQYREFFDELFPELPAHNELILVWVDHEIPENIDRWYQFEKLNSDGSVDVWHPTTKYRYNFDNYRRQTSAEKGEG